MARKSRFILVAVAIVLAGAAIVIWRGPMSGIAVSLFERNGGADGQLVLYGNVDIREVELSFRQTGRLISMTVDEGDRVKTGERVAEIDPEPFRDAVSVAEADVLQAEAELEKLRRGNRPQEIAQAEAAVNQAAATYDNAERQLERRKKLAASGYSPQSTLDDAQAARDQAAAALASAKENLALMKAGARSEDISAAEARLAAAKASLAQAKTALGDTRLVAPSNAVVLSRVREPGSMVSMGQPVYSLSLTDPVYVRAYVDEANLGRVAPGTKVTVRTDSSSVAYEGQIGFVSPRAEFTPKTVETTELRTDLVYRLRIVIANADDGLRQGMPVTVYVNAPAEGS